MCCFASEFVKLCALFAAQADKVPNIQAGFSKVDVHYNQGAKAGPGTLLELLGDFVKQIQAQGRSGELQHHLLDYRQFLGSAARLQHHKSPVVYQTPWFQLLWDLLVPAYDKDSAASDAYKQQAKKLANTIIKVTKTAV